MYQFLLLGEIRRLGRLPLWEKLSCKDRPDWPDGLEGMARMGQGRAGGSAVAGDGLRAPTLALEVRRAVESGGCHQFHWCCRGCGVFVSV